MKVPFYLENWSVILRVPKATAANDLLKLFGACPPPGFALYPTGELVDSLRLDLMHFVKLM
jgi:hypothetical protein